MEPASPKRSPGKADVKPSFHKPSQDAASRKYRRHTPIGGSDSSASEGSPLHRSRSPVYSKDRRKDDGRELEKNSHHNRLRRGNDSHTHSDRQSRVTSHDYARNSDYSRHNRHADDTDRGYQRLSHADRESRNAARSDYSRHESNTDRSRDSWRSSDKYSRDKSDRGKDNDLRSDDTAASKRRHKDSSWDDIRTGERDTRREKESQGERRDHPRSPSDHKNGRGSYREELRGHAKNSTLGRDCSSVRSKESLWSDGKESDTREKRRYDDRGSDRRMEKSTKETEAEMKNEIKSSFGYKVRERNERGSDKPVNASEDQSLPKICRLGFSEGPLPSKSIANDAHEKTSNSKQVKEPAGKFTSEPASSSIPQVETAQDLDAAKVAAMKVAELVNRNLVGSSYMTTDQKKKLLWGNKKSTTTEESGNRWDLQLFPDRERQEKFNKLMGVKIDAIPERKPEKKDGGLRVEKQEQLEMDLEKQYTAGLRRRDGRTVGLGL